MLVIMIVAKDVDVHISKNEMGNLDDYSDISFGHSLLGGGDVGGMLMFSRVLHVCLLH